MNEDIENDDSEIYQVVVNAEGQYSIWLDGRQLPAGWQAVGTRGSRDACLSHIEDVWTDMRPISVREKDGRPG
jgi:MbtH protein